MNRIHEELAVKTLLVAQGAGATSEYIDAATHNMIDFVVSYSLAAGEQLTAKLCQADDETGTGAIEIAESELVVTADAEGEDCGTAIISIRPSAVYKRYFAVKVGGDSEIISVVAICRVIYEPADHSHVVLL